MTNTTFWFKEENNISKSNTAKAGIRPAIKVSTSSLYKYFKIGYNDIITDLD